MFKRSFSRDLGKLEKDILELVDEVERCLHVSFEALTLYIEEGETEEVTEKSKAASRLESSADEIRRRIIADLFRGALLPNTRSRFVCPSIFRSLQQAQASYWESGPIPSEAALPVRWVKALLPSTTPAPSLRSSPPSLPFCCCGG